MKRGIFQNNDTFWQWSRQIPVNVAKTQTVSIKLLDDNSEVIMQWTLTNAFSTKITITDMKSEGNEIAIEMLEVAYEEIVLLR